MEWDEMKLLQTFLAEVKNYNSGVDLNEYPKGEKLFEEGEVLFGF